MLAYQRAKGEHTLDAYNAYLIQFNTSYLVSQATDDRNYLAFEQVSSEGTFKVYWEFMLQYPQSMEYEEAKKRYEKLLYEDYAKEDRLEDFMDFISKYPESPYIGLAIQNIYRIRTMDNNERSYLDFIQDFPESESVKNAIDRLYHNYRETGETDFSYQYNFLDLNDSIKTASDLDGQYLVPTFENNLYGFMNYQGALILPYSYESVDEIYLCGNIQDDFLIVTENGRQIIISRTGKLIYDDDFQEVDDLGFGLLRINLKDKYGLIFKSGEIVIPPSYDDIQTLDQHFIKIMKGNKWYLYSHNGMKILPNGFSEIEKEKWFLLLKQGSKWTVLNNKIPFQLHKQSDPALNFKYDDIELIEDTQLICFDGEKEVVLGKDLEQLLPFERQNIFTLPEGWLIKKDSIYNLYDDAFVQVSGTGFSEVLYKGNWMAGKKDNSWVLYQNFAPYPDVFMYDSIKILSNGVVLVSQNNSQFLIFLNKKKIELDKYKKITILRSSIESSEDDEQVEFIVVDYERKKSIVYNQRGKQVLKADPGSLQLLGNEYFKTTQKRKTGLSDTTGKVLLKPLYDAIANYDNGFVSILSNRKFGIYNKKSGIFLKPKYDRLLKPYNEDFLIAHMEDGLGLIDYKGEAVTSFKYEEIVFWNDSSFMARENDMWHIIDVFSNEYLLEGITDFNHLKNEKEQVLLIRIDDNYGIVSNLDGVIISPTFTDIIAIGSEDYQIYFAEKYISEAEFYIVIYYNATGEILKKQVFTDEEYDMIYCN